MTILYVPPCYWSINAHGEDTCKITDKHPFTDMPGNSDRFKDVPPLEYDLDPFTVFTWPFAISYIGVKKGSRYTEIGLAQDRIESFVRSLRAGSSIAFIYCTANNPITGDDNRPLLVGAGLVAKTSMPKNYSMSKVLLDHERSKPKMQNFPESAWQFKINLDPGCTVVLPYQEYLKRYEFDRSRDKDADMQKALRSVFVPIVEEGLKPHFKYGSMHVPSDKALYLLYMMKRSVERMRDGDVVDSGRLDEMQSKIKRMLEVAWRERGRYPGLENVADAMLKDHLGDDDSRRRVSSRIADAVRQSGIGPAIAALGAEEGQDAGLEPVFKKACRVLKSRQEELEFLARLDLSAPQASRILRKIDDEGHEGVAGNPYRLLDWPATYFEKDWDSNNFDPGLSLYQIDMAMVPDPDYAAWDHGFDADSPERLGAAVADILTSNADETGSTYMTRDGIVQGLEEYPLYYISKKFNIGRGRLKTLERDPTFAASFRITSLDAKDGAHYQLKSMRSMEEKVEGFVDKMLEKKYDPGDPWDDADLSKHALAELHPAEKERRKKAYSSVLSGGMFVLSGKAGSGKTDAISTIIKRLKKGGVTPTYVVTPTGKAALVITERLKKDNQLNEDLVIVTTIDRLLYALVGRHCRTRGLYKNYKDALKNFLDHGPAHFDEFREAASKVGLNPRALIIDEASMVDQTHMAALLSVVSASTLRYLIVAGDERQLPPIGFGSPFTDIIHHLKHTDRDGRHIRLEGNLRFSKDTALGELAGLFEEDKEPSMPEIMHAIERVGDRSSAGSDKTLLVSYFDDAAGLEKIMTSGLSAIASPSGSTDGASIRDLIGQIITGNGPDAIDLDKVQILSPRRAGQFGTWATNQRIDKGWPLLGGGAKVICEKNMYMDARKGGNSFRVLGLANGSMGCIKADGTPYFPYLDDLRKDYDELDDWEVRQEIGRSGTEGERYDAKLALGYAITIHKAQGSSFDHTLLILSDMGRFVSRELLYTALTRAKQDVHLLVRSDLREKLPSLLSRAFVNSSTATRKTLLFGPKGSPFRSYRLGRRQGGTIEVRSKAEWMIAKLLDESGIDFAYEPDDLYQASRMRPDFKIAGKFYLEHLGLTHDSSYMTRWEQKRGEYRRLGLEGRLSRRARAHRPTLRPA